MSGNWTKDVTLAELKSGGVCAVEAVCCHCAQKWCVPYDFLPTATSLAKIATIMICPSCGSWSLELAPAAKRRSRLQ